MAHVLRARIMMTDGKLDDALAEFSTRSRIRRIWR